MAIGRPTKFTKTLGAKICERIAEGESIRTIVKDDNMPSASTIFRWLLDEDKKEFWEQYEKARNIQAELMFEELLEIADDGSNDYIERERQDGETYTVLDNEHIQRSRLRVDTRKWYLSKVLPKKFGEKIDLTSLGEQVAVAGFNFLKNENNHADDSANG
ncbi:terminase small subunit protein [Bradyrhizobium sp. UNPF46]|uniref:terminase small subunit-like protein n=1 Tax=Bradyrhizobium sp. UNPF46 TaxID=1141168 RepID=UPI00115388AD|nr:terminase small subunit protein [Bradyrhizobium sp. UNPF46]